MYKACLCVLIAGLIAAPATAQVTVTAPGNGANGVASANDFASQQMQDPWDMSQRSDPGWWLNSNDNPSHGWSSISFANGIFTGFVQADPNIWLLETNFPNLPPIGKNGDAYPINANVYRLFAMRMCVPTPAYFLLYWTTKTMHDPPGLQVSNVVTTTAGCRIYMVDLAQLGLLNGSEPWNGVKRSLRLDPAPDNAAPGSRIDIDWVRLVDIQPALSRTITWNNTGGAVNIYLDNDNNAANGNLGVLAENVQGSSYAFNAGALAGGDYYVAIQRTTGGSVGYSQGFYRVNDAPVINITAPSEEGSSDDFATTKLGDPWDFNANTDVDLTVNVTNGGVTTIPNVETEAGASLGNIGAWYGVNTNPTYGGLCASFSKPAVYPLFRDKRGKTVRIDPTRYRILTAELGLPNKPRDLCNGSIVRIAWHVVGEPFETTSWGITLNSRAGANTLAKLNFDMASLPLDTAAANTSNVGWVPGSSGAGIQSLRFDPHEFADPTGFFIKRIKLAAFEKVNTAYVVSWTSSKGGTARVYYDTDKDPTTKTLIGSVATGTSGSLNWDTSKLPQGAVYYVWVEVDDGIDVGGGYAKWPVIVDHNAGTATMVLNRTLLNFGVAAGVIKTPAQLLRLSFQNAPAGQPCWTAASSLAFVLVSPASGCGGATLTVQLANQNYNVAGDYSGSVVITTSGALNSPLAVTTIVRVRPSMAPPNGTIDTPDNGVTVSGSLAVTGWAIDDVGVARVTICRAPVAGEQGGHPACGAGQVYLGDAVMIDDARPDVAAAAPNNPLNYRAGWGFLVLTNMLPNQGNGVFTLYANAIDLEGWYAGLGSRTINANNAAATEPFGAIDTPGQGETIAGMYANYGWVLSRVRRADPPGGGRVSVFVDGVAVGSPAGWTARSDLSAAFPGYPGINTALAVYGLNSALLANGLHTIMWVVTDNGGVTAGVGSRFFSVFNANGAMTEQALRQAGPDVGRPVAELRAATSPAPVLMRTGFNLAAPSTTVAPGFSGARMVWATERDRVEIRLNPSSSRSDGDEYAGYLLVDGHLRELPIGSSFDPDRGIFYWQPGLAFSGAYDFMFVRMHADGTRERMPVRVTLEPGEPSRFASGWRFKF